MLSPEHLARMRRPLAEAAGLPGEAYRDPAFLAEEMTRLFERRWISVGFGQQVASPGDVLPLTIGGHPLLLVRDGEGQLRVFHNVCRHRGLQLVEGTGCRSTKALTCPYHGWTYGLDGQCSSIPYWDRARLRPRRPALEEGYGLLEVSTRVWLDVVFVDLSGQAPPFEEVIEPLDKRWGGPRVGPRQVISRWEAELGVNWKLVIENFMDAYHLPFVHPQGGSPASAAQHEIVRLAPEVFGARYLHGGVARKWSSPIPPIEGLADVLEDHAESFFLFPNTLLFAHPGFVAFRTIHPRGPEATYEIELVYVTPGALGPEYAEQRAAMASASRLINDQDLPILARLQATRASAALDRGRFLASWDTRAHLFQLRVAEVLAGVAERP
jgi:choline monooxygenase